MLAMLPFIGGCVCDPPVERLVTHKRVRAERVALKVPAKSPAAHYAARPSATSVLKPISVKRCDCPQEFDPDICGDRSAYTWATDCSKPASSVLQSPAPASEPVPAVKLDKPTPASLKGPAQP